MQRRLYSFIAIPALAFGLAACGSSSKSSTPATSGSATTTPAASATTAPAGASGPAISIDSAFKFTTTPVKAGSTVTVKNNSSSQHTVTADDAAGGFNVTIDAGKTATFTAPAAGTYKFHCNIHNFMMGTLTVT